MNNNSGRAPIVTNFYPLRLQHPVPFQGQRAPRPQHPGPFQGQPGPRPQHQPYSRPQGSQPRPRAPCPPRGGQQRHAPPRMHTAAPRTPSQIQRTPVASTHTSSSSARVLHTLIPSAATPRPLVITPRPPFQNQAQQRQVPPQTNAQAQQSASQILQGGATVPTTSRSGRAVVNDQAATVRTAAAARAANVLAAQAANARAAFGALPSNVRTAAQAANDRAAAQALNVHTAAQAANIGTAAQAANVRTAAQATNVRTAAQATNVRTAAQAANVRTAAQAANVRTAAQAANVRTAAQTTTASQAVTTGSAAQAVTARVPTAAPVPLAGSATVHVAVTAPVTAAQVTAAQVTAPVPTPASASGSLSGPAPMPTASATAQTTLFTSQGGIKSAQCNPEYLHSNSTSHTWIFSAIAELIDNAYDPDVSASHMWIDLISINGVSTMVFQDNGNGLEPPLLHKMLSFGYSDKKEVNGHKPIGQYGNGFKSGSMRLGKDAMVFTKSRGSRSIGLLSQTYLKAIGAETVLVPIVTLDSKGIAKSPECAEALKEILKHSLFATEAGLLKQFDLMNDLLKQFDLMNDLLKQSDHMKDQSTGTRIIIWNLAKDSEGRLELDINSDRHDFINSEHHLMDNSDALETRAVREYMPLYKRSLREYISILYYKPILQVDLRMKRVRTKKVTRDLKKTEVDVYKPQWLDRHVQITFGFNKAGSEDYGMMLYHHNRLVQAYVPVGPQKKVKPEAVGIVGVVEADFLVPTHNKQDFSRTEHYNTFMHRAGSKLRDYWAEKTDQEIKTEQPCLWTWVQCCRCSKWRRLQGVTDESEVPDKWYCRMNQDPAYNRCDIAAEEEDEQEYKISSCTYKKKGRQKQQQQQQPQASPDPVTPSTSGVQHAGSGAGPVPINIVPIDNDDDDGGDYDNDDGTQTVQTQPTPPTINAAATAAAAKSRSAAAPTARPRIVVNRNRAPQVYPVPDVSPDTVRNVVHSFLMQEGRAAAEKRAPEDDGDRAQKTQRVDQNSNIDKTPPPHVKSEPIADNSTDPVKQEPEDVAMGSEVCPIVIDTGSQGSSCTDALEAQNKELSNQLNAAHIEIEQLKRLNSSMRKEWEPEKQELRVLKEELQQSRIDLEGSKTALRRNSLQVKTLEEELDTQKSRVKSLVQELAEVKAKEKRETATLIKDLQAAKENATAAASQLAQVKKDRDASAVLNQDKVARQSLLVAQSRGKVSDLRKNIRELFGVLLPDYPMDTDEEVDEVVLELLRVYKAESANPEVLDISGEGHVKQES